MSVQEQSTQPDPGHPRKPLPVAPLQPADTTPEPRGKNLLDYRLFRAVMESPLYPKVFQWAVLAGFVFVGYQILAGPQAPSKNIGTVLMWVIWWPLIPIAFLLMGRFWCAICPFATVNDWVQKVVGLERPVAAVPEEVRHLDDRRLLHRHHLGRSHVGRGRLTVGLRDDDPSPDHGRHRVGRPVAAAHLLPVSLLPWWRGGELLADGGHLAACEPGDL